MCFCVMFFFFSSRRRHTRCALVTGVQTCALPISFLLVLLFSASWLAEASGAEAVQNYFYLLPLASLTTAWSQIASQWLVRKQAFKETAAVTVNNAVLVNGIRVLAGIFRPLASTLSWITIAEIGRAHD